MEKSLRLDTRRRVTRALRIAAAACTALTVAAAAAHVWLDSLYTAELTNIISGLEEQGIPTTMEQLTGSAPPAARNAAAVILRALPPAGPGKRHSWEAVIERVVTPAAEGPSEDEIGEARKLMAGQLAGTLRQLHRAAALPEARYPLAPGTLDLDGSAVASAGLAVRLLTTEGILRHAAGDSGGAVESFGSALRIAHTLGVQRDRTGWAAAWPAVNLALSGIQTAHRIRPLDAAQMRRLDRLLGSIDWTAGSGNVLDAFTVSAVTDARRWQAERGLRGLLRRPYAAGMYVRLLEMLQTVRSLSGKPWREWPAGVRNPPRTNWLAPGRALAEMMRPWVTGPFWQRDAIIACCGAVRLKLALEAHRQRTGEYPLRLHALEMPAGGPPPADPFAGEPFRYARTRSGYLFYSIGPDLRDDQGRVRKKTKQPLEEGDLVWDARSWLPRQPE